MKFRLKKGKGSVQRVTDAAGVTHLPGDIVDLPASYDGEAWLERVELEESEKAGTVETPAPLDASEDSVSKV